MKRLWWCAASLAFATFVLGISVWRQSQRLVQAQTGVDGVVTEASSSGSLGDWRQQFDYYLVYPGMLPDHPLYFLKMIRDRVKLAFMGDAVQRSDLELLYADKRIGAARELAEGGKMVLAVETAVKAEQYLAQSMRTLKEDASEVQERWQTLFEATYTHEEILRELKDKADDAVSPTLSGLLDSLLAIRSEAAVYAEVGEETEGAELLEEPEELLAPLPDDSLEPRL